MTYRPSVLVLAPPRKTAYWWNEEVATARRECIACRRRYVRSRRGCRPGSPSLAEMDYRLAKKNFRFAIKRAKVACWKELIQSIDEDPWGLPYKLILNRLRRSTPCLTEILDSVSLGSVLNSLFPVGGDTRSV